MLPIVTLADARVVGEPELRFAPNGMAVCKMRTVMSKKKKDDQGEWVDDKVLWLTATCFGDLAEHTAESVEDKDLVTLVGRLQTDEWTTEGGDKRSAVTLVADSVAVSLKFRRVPHGAGKTERSSTPPQEDPWATPPTEPAAPGVTTPAYEEPPF